MSNFTVKKDINLATIASVLVAGAAFYFGTTYAVKANAKSASDNKAAIIVIDEKISGLDLVEFKLENNAKALARIEAKLDE